MNEKSLIDRKRARRREYLDKFTFIALFGSMIIAVLPFILLMSDVIIKGLPFMTPSFFLEIPRNFHAQGGILNAITGSGLMMIIACVLALPLSIGAAVYITEYVRQGQKRMFVETASDILAGIPSIVYGAFGLTFFIGFLNLPISALAGGLTLGLMMIPTVLRTTQEALIAIPRDLREASLALGVTKFRTTFSSFGARIGFFSHCFLNSSNSSFVRLIFLPT